MSSPAPPISSAPGPLCSRPSGHGACRPALVQGDHGGGRSRGHGPPWVPGEVPDARLVGRTWAGAPQGQGEDPEAPDASECIWTGGSLGEISQEGSQMGLYSRHRYMHREIFSLIFFHSFWILFKSPQIWDPNLHQVGKKWQASNWEHAEQCFNQVTTTSASPICTKYEDSNIGFPFQPLSTVRSLWGRYPKRIMGKIVAELMTNNQKHVCVAYAHLCRSCIRMNSVLVGWWLQLHLIHDSWQLFPWYSTTWY